MPYLVICEKPSVAQDVAKALIGPKAKRVGDHWEGPDVIVAFAVGHLVEQVDPDAYDNRYKKWSYDDLPILPEEFRYHPRDARAAKTLKGLHALRKRPDVDVIVNACDAGREGELIFKLILETAPKAAREKPVRRAWFSSMTQKAIRDAFDALRDDEQMQPLEAAARARSEADWLVGMNATRAATTKAGSIRKVLSLGRVQTPTLALIVNRDLAIAAFVPEDYWEVEAQFATAAGAAYRGLWHEGSTTRLTAAEPAEAIAAATGGQPGVVEALETKPQTEQPPLLYDLTTLQREATGRFGFSASRTLGAAQALYETGDAAAFEWAVDVITQRRSTDTKKPDIRALVVRDLVELGGERARGALTRALAQGPGNDWLVAWTQVALLELGDLAQLPPVEAALGKEDWNLDRRGFRSIWRAISPFLQAAAGILLTGGLGAMTAVQQIQKAVQLVGNFAAGERSRYLAKVDARQGATAQLRWQAAEALAAAKPKNAVALLEGLLADEAPPVRMSAALALAELPDPKALDGLARAFALDYGAENGVSRTPEVRAALLRAAWLRDAQAPASREMARLATTDPDGAVRFIGWAILRVAPASG